MSSSGNGDIPFHNLHGDSTSTMGVWSVKKNCVCALIETGVSSRTAHRHKVKDEHNQLRQFGFGLDGDVEAYDADAT